MSLGLEPDLTTARDRLANAPVLAQREAERKRRGQLLLKVDASSGSFARLSGAEHALLVALHDRRLTVQPQRVDICATRSRVERANAAGSSGKTRCRGYGVARQIAPVCRLLLEPQQDRGLVRVLLESEDVVTAVNLPAAFQQVPRFRGPREPIRGLRGSQQRRRSSQGRLGAVGDQ